MIEVDRLAKSYGELVAIDGVTFKVVAGAVFGLLGPNGAGKSTAIGCISGLLEPSGGRITVNGHDVVTAAMAARAELGVVPQELALYDDISARDNLQYWGGAYGLNGRNLEQRVTEVLEQVGLLDRAREPVKRFSGGMKRRLNFACGIVHRPRCLLLDEPTVGVDPQSRMRLLEMIREQARAGAAVLYTTHYMEEASELCDQLAIIDHGKVIASGTLAELRGIMGERDLLRLSGSFDPDQVRRVLAPIEGIEVISIDKDVAMLAVVQASKRLPAIFNVCASVGAEIRETTLTQSSLETLFIKLTGRELRE